jgi:hypothetical protein
LGYSATFGVPFLLAVTAAIPFSAVHILSNAVIFSQVVPMLDTALHRQLKDLIWSTESKVKVDMLERI